MVRISIFAFLGMISCPRFHPSDSIIKIIQGKAVQLISVNHFFLIIAVIVKSSGCLQIGFGPLIIDYILYFLFDPPNSS